MKINLLREKSDWKEKLQEGFDTDRLIFRVFSEDDFKAVLKISSDIELFTYVADINSSDDLRCWLQSVWQKRNYLFFTIKNIEGYGCNEGVIGILMLNKNESNGIEVGGWIGKEFQNKGYGKETTSGIVRFIKEKTSDILLCAKTREDNFAGLRVLNIDGIERVVNRRHLENDSD